MDEQHYHVLSYHVPSQPSAARVGVWRELKRMGVLYLQQSVCIVPTTPALLALLQRIVERITELGGTYHLLPITTLPDEEAAKIVEGFITQSNLQYDEIIENCEVNFSKEIEFETFRQNFTYAEAEEIRQELDKIQRWYERVVERDWFGAARRDEAASWIQKSEHLLEGFEEQVFLHQESDESSTPSDEERRRRQHPRRPERKLPERSPFTE